MRRKLPTFSPGKTVILMSTIAACHCGEEVVFKGTLAGPRGDSGVLKISIPAHPSTSVAIRGTLTAGGSSDLRGTFDPDAATVTLTGGGYSFSGKLTGETISGSYSGPKGEGDFAAQSTASSEVTVYCGSFDGAASGVWNLNVATNGTASGSYSETYGQMTGGVTGQVTDGVLKISCDSTGAASCTASGTLSGGSAHGTWSSQGLSGSWKGSDCP
jgi:hypothetical protein